MKTNLLVLTLILFAGFAIAKTTYRGCVVDGVNHEPLAYGMVKCLQARGGALTDTLGIFEITAYERDSLIISYAGYEDLIFPCANFKDTTTIMLTSRVNKLNELVVKPKGKSKTKVYGKRHRKGIMMGNGYLERGDSYGVSVNAKNRQTWLTHVGFYVEDGSVIKENALLQINVYDTSKAKGSPTRAFINVLDNPININFHSDSISDHKFTYCLSTPILLPERAFVEITNLENETLYPIFSCNIIGSSEWSRYKDDNKWIKDPFPTPFFVICQQYKQ